MGAFFFLNGNFVVGLLAFQISFIDSDALVIDLSGFPFLLL